MSLRLNLTRTDRAALADAIRDMRRSGIRPRDLTRATGTRPYQVSKINREVRK